MSELTVAICIYNAEKYIVETLKAVCAQTMQDFDLLLVDDCSTDHSISLAKEFLTSVNRKYHLHEFEENNGIAFARNYSLNLASTKYLIFIDADDIPHPDLVEKEYKLLDSDSDLMGVTSWTKFVNKDLKPIVGGQRFGEKSKEEFIVKAKAGKRIFLPIQTMFRRECALRAGGFTIEGFPEGKPRYRDYCEDLDLWTRMSDFYVEGKAFVGIQEYLYDYRKIEGLSSNHFNMIIKMNYVKYNVRRRRNGLNDVTFIEYMDTLDPDELKKLKFDSKCADDLRNGVYYMHQGQILKSIILVIGSIWKNPMYLFEKLRHNI